MREGNPVVHLEFAALAAHRLPEIDDVGLALGRRLIEGLGIGLGPVEENGPERKLH
ncbi:hypothetical protein D3C84_1187790 [compost metagenome]